MRALRIVLEQASANYRKEETMLNKMTYPLPPVSTVIGALHAACGYTEYHEMDISIQGKYGVMTREPYTDYCFLNSTMDDRGILVKMKNAALLSTAYDKVASAKKSMGNSFRNEITIQVHNRQLLGEYQALKEVSDQIKEFKSGKMAAVLAMVKTRKATLAKKKKRLVKGSEKYQRIEAREKEIKAREKKLKDGVKSYEQEHYTKPISQFRSLTTSLKFYEVLHEIKLVLHIRAEEQTLQDIYEHIYELKAIGRSEDFVNVKEVSFVELSQETDYFENPYAAYIALKHIREEKVYTKADDSRVITGTKYYLNKNYDTEKAKTGVREFCKVPVIYTSEHSIYETAEDLFVDELEGQKLIVNFL
ncbi:CRISPR-associated protein Cas5 [[Clostridium] polysaccharolyticum]|uniref:CRISPR-associated protein Cas5t n=1 Tax=[Clostridium] polysaccharolyticum TaxID=29364 RepID=A0A1I0F8F8_9FIRM|nr:CRISPR-associated protein Cas5 [[Clostridium] polysaccharolyticum]SET53740.1 CRISPR-associated protein Cas5t [[Clostridium] polysaccharolyticum]